VLCEVGGDIDYVYFFNEALVSLTVPVDQTEFYSVALVGRDGMAGASVAMGAWKSLVRVTVLCAGGAFRMRTLLFLKAFNESPQIRESVLQYLLALHIQAARTAACNRFHRIEQRLARWLLMSRDRLSTDHFHMTHETLGLLLGVRRVGVTNAAHDLKLRCLIDYSRGAIDIINGAGLRGVACSCYHPLEGRHGVS